jgi:5'-nucleotidase
VARILVTNDDGVESSGLIALAEGLRPLGDVFVVAPDGDRSGVSHAISIRDAVRVREVAGRTVPTYACSGMPADCVILGVHQLAAGPVDFVVSGINRGANVADDINYSGTVAAAVEALLIGVPSLAVSLAATWPAPDVVHHWETAATIARETVERTLADPLPPLTFWNLNVPNVAVPRGVRVTRQGRKRYGDRLAPDPAATADGVRTYRIWGGDVRRSGENTDDRAVHDGYTSLTPLRADRTDEALYAAYGASAPLRGR